MSNCRRSTVKKGISFSGSNNLSSFFSSKVVKKGNDMVSTVYNDKGKSKASDTFIIPDQQKKTKPDILRRHSRTQSSTSNNNEPANYNMSDNNNNRGWLESSSTQVNPSRSVDKKSMKRTTPATAINRKELSQKDILGAVSDEDILKLTEMTRLPDPSTSTASSNKKSRHRDPHNISISSSSDLKQIDPVTASPDSKPIIVTSTTSQVSSDIVESPSLITDSPEKRRSWLYKSLIKANKKGSSNNSKSKSTITHSDDNHHNATNVKSPAASIVDEFYQKNPRTSSGDSKPRQQIKLEKKSNNNNKHSRSHTLHPSLSANLVGSSTDHHSRRHSFDSYPSLIKEDSSNASSMQDQTLNQCNQNNRKGLETPHDEQQERPSFQLHVQTDGINDETSSGNETEDYLMLRKQQSYDILNASLSPSTDASIDDEEEEPTVKLMFDYYSLPTEVKGLVDTYGVQGKVKRERMKVKFRKSPNSSTEDNASSLSCIDDDDRDVDDDDDDGGDMDDENEDNERDCPIVYYRDIIIGKSSRENINYKDNPMRMIATLTTTQSDKMEFTKLIQLASNEDQDGPLLDLKVCLFTDDDNTEENGFEGMLQTVNQKLSSLESFKKESLKFLQDHVHTLDSLELLDHTTAHHLPTLSRTHSQPSFQRSLEETSGNSSLSLATSSQDDDLILYPARDMLARKERNIHSMYITNENATQFSYDPFEERHDEVRCLIKVLQGELHEFKTSVMNTEKLVSDVQQDMDDFRMRDIPETHYSALKKLEVDIESILSKRAKKPWLDTGYTLLSYLLTLCALIVWVIIYILKWAKKVVLFPRKLWQVYSDYLVERNRVVKKASIRSVTGNNHL